MVKLDTSFLFFYSLLKRTYCTCFGINWGARTSHVRYTVYQFIILCNMFLPGQPSRAQSIWNYIEELFMMCRTVARTVFSTLQYIMYARHPGPKSTSGHNHVNSSFHQQSGWDGIPMDSKYVPPASSLRYLLMKLSYCLRLIYCQRVIIATTTVDYATIENYSTIYRSMIYYWLLGTWS